MLKKLSSSLRKLGCHELSAADYVFVRGTGVNMVVLLVYVDDMVILSESSSTVQATQRSFMKYFKTIDLDPLKYFLGMKLERSADGLSIRATRDKNTELKLEWFSMEKSSHVSTQMGANFLSISGNGPKDEVECKQVEKLSVVLPILYYKWVVYKAKLTFNLRRLEMRLGWRTIASQLQVSS